MKYIRISLAAQLLLAVYFQLILWFPLGRWNYQPGATPLINSPTISPGDAGIACLFLIPFILCAVAFRRNWAWLMWAGVAGYGAWLSLQIQTWWVPYIFGASDRWEEVYHRVFSHSTALLPSIGNHLAPDAMHLVIQLLLCVIVVTLITGLLQMRKKMGSGV